MHPESESYHFSFFKPTTESARRNRNLVVQLVLIWAVAVFGFQILLQVLGKPTPEPAYALYQEGWAGVTSGNPSREDLQLTAQAALSVLGKVAIQPQYQDALNNAISWAAIQLIDKESESAFMQRISEFEQTAERIDDIQDPVYLAQKKELIPVLGDLFGLPSSNIRAKIAPLHIRTSRMQSFGDENRGLFEEAMDLYLIHNQSVLTDTRFLGFPFHYFYTAVFLLILFVGLCWLYCVRIDMFNRKYGIKE